MCRIYRGFRNFLMDKKPRFGKFRPVELFGEDKKGRFGKLRPKGLLGKEIGHKGQG